MIRKRRERTRYYKDMKDVPMKAFKVSSDGSFKWASLQAYIVRWYNGNKLWKDFYDKEYHKRSSKKEIFEMLDIE